MEHLPIKKRRFLFQTSSPPLNTESLATCPTSSSQEVQPKQDPSCPPTTSPSLTVADLSKSNANKVDQEKLLKASDNKDACGISLGSYGTKNLEPLAAIKLEPKTVNLPNISSKETGLHLPTTTVPSLMHSTLDKDNQVTSHDQKSDVNDERLNWDLNTVMAWEESPECDHNINISDTSKEGNSKVCKQELVFESASENIVSKSLIDMRSLTHSINSQKPEVPKQTSNNINKLLFPVPVSTINHHLDTSINGVLVPSIVKLEYPPCDISKTQKVANGKLKSPMTAGTGLSLDYVIPPSFNNITNTRPLEKNVVSSINTEKTTENQNLNLSLVTLPSLQTEVHQIGTCTEEDDKSKVKRVITSSLTDKGSQSSQDAYKALNQNSIGSLLVIQSSVLPEVENQPSTVASVNVSKSQGPIKAEKSTLTTPCQVGIDNENNPSDIQGSEVDNVEEFSVGCDSQFEDGEFRELSIQTWEGSENENRENENETNNKENSNSHENNSQCVPESSSRIRSADVTSQKGTDEISSVLLPEKPDTSEQISNSEPNETREVSINTKDESESDQWKMNVSGSENLPDDYTVKFYKRERDGFLNRGSRFRVKGYSSSNGDDTVKRPVRSFKRGNNKYSAHVRSSKRGGATWNRSMERPGPTLTNEQNDDVGPVRQNFRTRLEGNREEDDFRARLGLRPAGDTRVVGRGRNLRYSTRGGGVRGRYSGPANEYEYSHSSFPRRRCFSPTDQRENHPCVHHRTVSTSPPRSRTRSRSPRIRRLRFNPDECNNSPPGSSTSTRWVKYNPNPTRSTVFNRSPPPIGERLTFYDSSRNTNRAGHPARFSEVHGGVMDHGYNRRGGFVKRHPVKHIEYEEEDGYGPVEDMEFHGRGNPKPYSSSGTESRFREIPTRAREERDNW